MRKVATSYKGKHFIIEDADTEDFIDPYIDAAEADIAYDNAKRHQNCDELCTHKWLEENPDTFSTGYTEVRTGPEITWEAPGIEENTNSREDNA